MTIGMTSSLQGMERAETQFNQVAQNCSVAVLNGAERAIPWT